jgi:hypothetical protein
LMEHQSSLFGSAGGIVASITEPLTSAPDGCRHGEGNGEGNDAAGQLRTG